MVETGAIIQGLITATIVVGLIVLYVDRMSNISNNLEDISASISQVNDDIRKVDLKSMEKTTNKLETFLEAELQQRYSGTTRTNGQNSVKYTLDSNDIDTTISWVGDPDWHSGLRSKDTHDKDETVFEIKFDKELDTQAITGRLITDENFAEFEENMFDGTPSRLLADSPYQISCAVPTSDIDEVGEYVGELVQKIDQHITFIRKNSEKFDKNIEQALENN